MKARTVPGRVIYVGRWCAVCRAPVSDRIWERHVRQCVPKRDDRE